MRLEKCGALFLGLMIGIWITGNFTHWVIDVYVPNQELVAKAERENAAAKPPKPKRNDTGLYAKVLNNLPSCTMKTEPDTGDKFFTCPDGSTISQINWTRNASGRKGVVTRYFNREGVLLLIYGHPDDDRD